MEYNNHLKIGSMEVEHKGKKIATSLNSTSFEDFYESLDDFDFDVGIIPPGFEHRADLISDLFYNTPTLDWMICLFNDISDPFQELTAGKVIKIPRMF
jgi:hypothetical protein